MSWAEVYKVNSDITGEPLNFTDYIYDISVFGEESYVMDSNNAVLWDKFALNSCYLYGHQAIHEYVYNRLTEDNIDDLFDKSGKLGRQMNNFHNNTAYAIGGAKEVLAGMTMNTYNDMIDKFRLGYQRYVDKHLQAEAVGQWILEVFNVDLSAYNTIEEIVMTSEAWELALHNEPLMVALTSSEYVMTLIAESEVATEKFADAIYYAGQNEKAINVIANYDTLVQQVVNDQTSMEWIASSENAIMVILENENFATQALASEVAMTAFGNSETAVMLICEFVANIPVSSNALTAIDESMTEIDAQIGSVLNGSDISGKIADAHTAIEVAVKAIDDVTENAVMVDNMVALISQNNIFAMQACSNIDIYTSIMQNGYGSVFANSEPFMSIVAESKEHIQIIYNSPEETILAIESSTVAKTALGNSSLVESIQFALSGSRTAYKQAISSPCFVTTFVYNPNPEGSYFWFKSAKTGSEEIKISKAKSVSLFRFFKDFHHKHDGYSYDGSSSYYATIKYIPLN